MNPFGIPPEHRRLFRFLSRLLAAALAVSISILLADISAQLVPSRYAGITYVVVGATNWMFYYWMGCKILRRFGLMPE